MTTGTPEPSKAATKSLRPAIVPSVSRSAGVDLMLVVRKLLLESGLNQLSTTEEHLGAFVLALATDGGIAGGGMLWVLRHLDGAELTADGMLLMRSVRPTGDKATIIQLPALAEMVLRIAISRMGSVRPAPIFSQPEDARQKEMARQHLDGYWSSLKCALDVSEDLSWKAAEPAARVIAHLHGIPSLVISLMSEAPSPQHPWWQAAILGPSIEEATQQSILEVSHISEAHFGQSNASGTSVRTRRRRVHGAYTLDRLFKLLREVTTGKLTSAQLEKADDLRDQLLCEADQHWPEKSSVHLMVHWCTHRLHGRGRPTVATVERYARRLWHKAMSGVPGHEDLTLWKDAEYRQFCERVMENVEEPETAKSTRILIRDLSRFATRHGFWTCSTLRTLNEMTLDNPRRARIIGLHEFDWLISGLMSRHNRYGLEMAALLILIYWGGLRPKAIEKLTLRWIDIRDEEVNVRAPRVKTAASQLIVPLHLIAPTDHVAIVRKFVQLRREEMPRARIGKAKLFGMSSTEVKAAKKTAAKFNGSARRRRARARLPTRQYWDELRKSASDLLKNMFGPDTVLYCLRHSCGSWLLVRLMALGCLEIRGLLVDGNHRVFSDEAESRFWEFASAGEYGTPRTSTPATGLGAIMKLFAHAEYQTFFSHYDHALHIVQAGYQRAADRGILAQRLSNEAVAAITGLSSSASLARLDKTVRGQIAWLRARDLVEGVA